MPADASVDTGSAGGTGTYNGGGGEGGYWLPRVEADDRSHLTMAGEGRPRSVIAGQCATA